MSKFNKPNTIAKIIEKHPDRVENFERGIAFKMDALSRLYSRVCTTLFGEKKFYQSGEDHNKEIVNDIQEAAKVNPEFILKLAAYARNEMYLRTIPIVMLAEASRINECKPYVRQWTPHIIKRADELTEVFAYYFSKYGNKKIPNSLKKGVADTFENFNEFNLEKYNSEKKSVTFRDVLRLTHPVPKDEKRNSLYKYLTGCKTDEELKKILLGLPIIYAKSVLLKQKEFNADAKKLAGLAHATWEVLVSKFGSTKEVWETCIPNTGYMAKLRNLRNFIEKEVNLTPVIDHLTDENAVLYSKQLPFRFLSAYREVEKLAGPKVSKLLTAIARALEISCQNLPKLPGVTLICADNSGSMGSALSDKSSVSYQDIANLMGCIAHKMCDESMFMLFGQTTKVKNFNYGDTILSNMGKIVNGEVGHSTNGYLCIDYLLKNKIKVDRIIVFSDMQLYGGSFVSMLMKYRSTVNSKVKVYSIDLAGYGTLQVPQDDSNSCLIAGWSEKVLSFISSFEESKQQAVDKILVWEPSKYVKENNA